MNILSRRWDVRSSSSRLRVNKASHYSNNIQQRYRFAHSIDLITREKHALPHNRRPRLATRYRNARNFLSRVAQMRGVISSNGDAYRYRGLRSEYRRAVFVDEHSIPRMPAEHQSRAYDRKLCLDRVKYMNQRLSTCRTYGLPHVFAMTWLVRTYDSRCESGGSLNDDRKCRNVRPIRAMLQVESKSSDRNRASPREPRVINAHGISHTPSRSLSLIPIPFRL